MINVRVLFNSVENKAKYEALKAKEKQALATPATLPTPKPNECIIQIAEYYFSQNIGELTTTLNLGIKKFETLTSPIYLSIGGNEERIEFEADFLHEEILALEGFKQKVQENKPLPLKVVGNDEVKQILIETLTIKKSIFTLNAKRERIYAKLTLGIAGVVL